MHKYDDIFIRIKNPVLPYSPVDQKISVMVLENPEFVLNASIQELAKRAEVSEPSITRFCKRIGFQGVKNFKICLAQSLALSSPMLQRCSSINDDVSKVSNSVFNSCIDAFSSADKNIKKQSQIIEEAIISIACSSKIEFFGSGSDFGTVAKDAKFRFFRLSMSSNYYCDPDLQLMAAATVEKGDIVFAITGIEENPALLKALKVAKSYGATIISLSYPESPVSKVCDLSITVDTFENTDDFTPSIIRLVYLAILDLIVISVAQKKGFRVREKLTRIHKSLIIQDKPLSKSL